MAIEICPLASDIGNLADWVGVLVGVGAAVATTVVAVIAHRTSKKAAEIAEDAAKIAGQQHREAVDLRVELGKILGRTLAFEVTELPSRLIQIYTVFEAVFDVEAPNGLRSAAHFSTLLDLVEEHQLLAAQDVQDRIHNLPDGLGTQLATLIGAVRSISDQGKRMRSRSRVTVRQPDQGGITVEHSIPAEAIAALRMHLRFSTIMAIDFAHRLQDFVRIPRSDYQQYTDLVSAV